MTYAMKRRKEKNEFGMRMLLGSPEIALKMCKSMIAKNKRINDQRI